MANEKNLKPGVYKLTVEQAKKGGINSGIARKRRKTLKEELLLLLETEEFQQRISTALLKEATQGNVRAYEVIRDTIGEKPVDVVENNVNLNNPYQDLTTEELRKLANDT